MKKNYTKKILLKVSLVLVSLVCVGVWNSQTYGPNLVQEPGFENFGASWNKSSNKGIYIVEATTEKGTKMLTRFIKK